MEAHSEDTLSSSSWSFATNYQISHGSLQTSITVDSSDSPLDTDLTAKSPLVLVPSASNPAPCEINITFKQKHEIRQIYVRSTARVYEIYYAPDLRCNSEYLCTVRCGIAERDQELLHTSEETVCKESKRKSVLSEEISTNGSYNGTSEDDWVEIQNPSSPALDKSNIQDFYEATAEIADSDPSISITLRLLSLQNKQRIIIDEIYIFADPVDEDSDSKSQTGSSLMGMLAPTLLQLSKSGVNCLQETQPSTKKQQENNDEKADESVAKNNDDVYSRFEGTLERLENRVGRIEDMFLRFEEKMVKPVIRIENRIQRVEEKLEELSGSFRNLSVLPSCSRFSAPAFSSLEESYSSSYNEKTDLPEPEKGSTSKDSLESERNPLEPEKIYLGNDDLANGFTAKKPLPEESETEKDSSAEDFPDSEKDFAEPEKDSPSANVLSRELKPEIDFLGKDSTVEKPKKTVSIDDALAAAFAGFFSETVSVPPKPNHNLERIDPNSVSNTDLLKYTQTLKVTAPDFSMEENDSEDEENSFPDSNSEEADEGCTLCSSAGSTIIAKEKLNDDDKQMIEELVGKGEAFVVDFETPILDVAFVSRKNSSVSFFLEDLLGVEVEESDSLVVLEDGGTNDNCLLLDFEDIDCVAKVEDHNREEVSESLI
jgi:hypothetical protein